MQEQREREGFDFDGWQKLAREDPDTFEIKRKIIIDAAIANAPQRNHDRLRRLQWKLDRIRDTSSTPLAACVRMQEMLWESVIGRNGLLERLRQIPANGKPGRDSARILQFRR